MGMGGKETSPLLYHFVLFDIFNLHFFLPSNEGLNYDLRENPQCLGEREREMLTNFL